MRKRRMSHSGKGALALLFWLWTATGVWGATDNLDAVRRRLEADGHDPQRLQTLFQRPEAAFDPEPMRRKIRARFERKFHASRIKAIQQGLNQLGYSAGPEDGLSGPKTRNAIRRFQRDLRLRVDGKPSAALLEWVERRLAGKDGPPPKTPSSPTVYKAIMEPERLEEAWEFLSGNSGLLGEVERQYKLPKEMAVAMLTVETRVGKYLGKKSAFATLASLAACRDYSRVEPFFADHRLNRKRRLWLKKQSRSIADWAYGELKALLEYSRVNNLDPLAMPGSVYGAIGICQFMPSNALRFGVDGNGDGAVDLFDLSDAVHSLASFLRNHGWRGGSQRRQRRAIYRYNPSRTYVNTVLAVADHLRERIGGKEHGSEK